MPYFRAFRALGHQWQRADLTAKIALSEHINRLDKKFLARPRFEDDEAIVDAFTVYGRAQEQIKRLQRELELLQK